MKQKITTKLANAERVADQALALSLTLVQMFELFLDTSEKMDGLTDQFPATRAALEVAKDSVNDLRKELEQP